MNHALSRLVKVAGLAALMIIGLCALTGGARAAEAPPEALAIEFSVSPAEMVAPGGATMTFILTNRTDGDIDNVCLTSADGLLSEPIGTLAAGETHTLTRPYTVTQAELDEGCVRYVLTHDALTPGGEKVTYALKAAVRLGDVRPGIDFTRQLSSRYVAPGSQLTITYRVTNNGNVPVSDILVRDALGGYTGSLERLEAGASHTFLNRVGIDVPAASDAVLEYTDSSGERVTRALEPVSIHLSEGALTAEFSVGRSVFDPGRADAVLVLTNAGSDNYADITVLDDVYGGVIADCVSLPQGGNPAEIGFTYPVRGEGEYRWRVTGVSQSGEALDFLTETVRLSDEPLAEEVDIRLNVTTGSPRINRAGKVRFDVSIANEGGVSARNLLLYEVSRGSARRLAVLPTGDPARFSVSYDVQADSRFIFCLTYEDADGRARTISAEPIEVEITPSGVAPESPEPMARLQRGGSVKFGSSSTFTILLAVASAALVSMFSILLATSLGARRDRRRRAAAQRRRNRPPQGGSRGKRSDARPASAETRKKP